MAKTASRCHPTRTEVLGRSFSLPAQRLGNILYITNNYRMEADMLILTRRVGESLTVGDAVKVTILSQKGNQVRVGIDAPRDLPVIREELQLRLEGATDDAAWNRLQS